MISVTFETLYLILSRYILDRLRAIETALLHLGVPAESGEPMISYLAPWSCPEIIKHESADMVLSQAVLEHVEELSALHRAIHGWLKPGGFVSHTIDLTSHGTARNWNGHWACSDRMWKLIKGRRPYFLNRKTCSEHLDEIRNAGFDIVREVRTTDSAVTARATLAPVTTSPPRTSRSNGSAMSAPIHHLISLTGGLA